MWWSSLPGDSELSKPTTLFSKPRPATTKTACHFIVGREDALKVIVDTLGPGRK